MTDQEIASAIDKANLDLHAAFRLADEAGLRIEAEVIPCRKWESRHESIAIEIAIYREVAPSGD